MQLKALGEIAKLTVGHNNRGHNPSWHVDHAELTNEAAGKLTVCVCACVCCVCACVCTNESKYVCMYDCASVHTWGLTGA